MSREMKIHPVALMVRPVGEPIYSEMATTIRLDDETDGPYIIIEQSGRMDIGKVAINPEEWPAIRDAVEQMFALCNEIDGEKKGEQT